MPFLFCYTRYMDMTYKVIIEVVNETQVLEMQGRDKSHIINKVWDEFGTSVIIKSIEQRE